MSIVRVSPHDLPDTLRRHIEGRIADLRMAAHAIAVRGAAEAEFLAQNEDIPDLGNYHRSFKAIPTHNGAALVNTSRHAVYVEHGRRPGKAPPFDKIQAWTQRKLGILDPRVAFLIQRKIARTGIKPRFVMRRIADWMKRLYVLESRRILSR